MGLVDGSSEVGLYEGLVVGVTLGMLEVGLTVGDDMDGVIDGSSVGITDGDFEGSKVLIVKFPLNSVPFRLFMKETVIAEVSGSAIVKGTALLLEYSSVHELVVPPNV